MPKKPKKFLLLLRKGLLWLALIFAITFAVQAIFDVFDIYISFLPENLGLFVSTSILITIHFTIRERREQREQQAEDAPAPQTNRLRASIKFAVIFLLVMACMIAIDMLINWLFPLG